MLLQRGVWSKAAVDDVEIFVYRGIKVTDVLQLAVLQNIWPFRQLYDITCHTATRVKAGFCSKRCVLSQIWTLPNTLSKMRCCCSTT